MCLRGAALVLFNCTSYTRDVTVKEEEDKVSLVVVKISKQVVFMWMKNGTSIHFKQNVTCVAKIFFFVFI